MKAVILAAGRGERLWPLTEHRPKHLLPVGGRAILERTVSALAIAGVKDIVVVVNYKAEMIKTQVGEGDRFDCSIKYVLQKRVGGTADALGAAQIELENEDHFVVVYGDDYYSSSAIRRFVEAAARGDVLIGAGSVKDPSRFGTLEVKGDFVTDIKEKASSNEPCRVNAGLYCLDGEALPAVKRTKESIRGEFELTDSLRTLIQKGEQVRIFPLEDGEWAGVSYPWDLLEANRLALEAEESVNNGTLEDNVQLKGKTVIEIGARVKSGSYVEGAVFIGEGAIVGPNAYLRPGTSLGRNVKVGASCEVKNSVLMDGTKIPHLSYVGDSVIGEETSLGAGTITANLRFDESMIKSSVRDDVVSSGRKKLGAILGDGVRTGINVSIFPGVKIGGGAWIGPGTVVREDVPSHGRLRDDSAHRAA